MAQAYTVKSVERAVGSDLQVRVFILAPGAEMPWLFHSAITDRYFGLEGTQSIGERYNIAPKTAHLISNRSEVDARFLLVQGVGTNDFIRVGADPPGA
jgi:hypothetical protein